MLDIGFLASSTLVLEGLSILSSNFARSVDAGATGTSSSSIVAGGENSSHGYENIIVSSSEVCTAA